MAFLLVPAAVFTVFSLVLATLWRGVLALRHRPAPRFWARTFKWHGGLLVVHLFVTVPLALALLFTSFVGTRGDEAAYAGPRIGEDGRWILQTRESLADEKAGKVVVPPAVQDAAAARAVSFTARDGVKLRGFLVPPAEKPGEDQPRFVAVLAHGLFRGALEIETPARCFATSAARCCSSSSGTTGAAATPAGRTAGTSRWTCSPPSIS